MNEYSVIDRRNEFFTKASHAFLTLLTASGALFVIFKPGEQHRELCPDGPQDCVVGIRDDHEFSRGPQYLEVQAGSPVKVVSIDENAPFPDVVCVKTLSVSPNQNYPDFCLPEGKFGPTY